jgi:transposase InsO family protein
MLLGRSSYYYRSRRKEHVALKMRLRDLAMVRVRFGYPRLTVLLKREGWPVGKKLVYRLYRELGLQMRTRKRRKLVSAQRAPAQRATKRNEKWSMDFIADRLEGGRRFRVLTVIDQFTRECLKLEAAVPMSGSRVVECLERVAELRGYPQSITVDNGTEFCSRALDGRALSKRSKARIHPTRLGRRKMASSRASTVGSEMNASTPICSGRLRMLVRKWKLGGWITTPADRIALLRTCLRLRSLRAPCGEKENNNRKWSHYWPETKIRPCPKIGTSSAPTIRP